MARDYLQEASSVISKPQCHSLLFSTLIPMALSVTFFVLFATAQGMMGPTLRKAAAYALGQIGEPRSVRQLREFYNQEPADGVRDAMRA